MISCILKGELLNPSSFSPWEKLPVGADRDFGFYLLRSQLGVVNGHVF